MNITNQILLKWIKVNRIKCLSCQTPLTLYKIKSRNDPDNNGIEYEGIANQVVWTKCSNCGTKNILNKLLRMYVL